MCTSFNTFDEQVLASYCKCDNLPQVQDMFSQGIGLVNGFSDESTVILKQLLFFILETHLVT